MQVLLFGGLELWANGRRRRGFESIKTAAAFSYLLLHRGRSFSREHLAALLWPEADERAARANIRQALYNIRTTMPRGRGNDWVLADRESVEFSSTAEIWVDCEVFEELVNTREGETASSHALARAAGLYRGDLLAGLGVRDSEPFEQWLGTEQARFRRAALDGLRRLVAIYERRGEYRLGIQYASKLVELDPLSEAGQRALMRLLDFAGERSRAMVHYRDFDALLRQELGVAPQQATTRLFEEIAARGAVSSPPRAGALCRPVVPFVGRRAVWAELAECWRVVTGGASQITLVEGEDGVGKTRLVRSFLDDLSAREQVTIVPGRCPSYWPHEPYGPLGGMIEQLMALAPRGREPFLQQISEGGREAISALVSAGAHRQAIGQAHVRRADAVAHGLAEILRCYANGRTTGSTGHPIVLFVDDAENAGPSLLRLLRDAIRLVGQSPVWVIAACNPVVYAEPTSGFDVLYSIADSRPVRIQVRRLAAEAIEEIARGLVEDRDVDTLSRVLSRSTDGLPLNVVLLVNTFWDEGVLQTAPHRTGCWRLTSEQALHDIALLTPLELVLRRLASLPPSARRLASLAAVAVEGSDAQLLARAEGETQEVVESAIEVLMERWFLRQTPSQWATDGLQAGASMWGAGARCLRLDFDHHLVRRAVLHSLQPSRRRVLHALLAAAMRQLEGAWEGALAYHYAGAMNWLDAAQFGLASIDRALAAGAAEDAARTVRFARRLMRLAADGQGGCLTSDEWKVVGKRLEALGSTLAASLSER